MQRLGAVFIALCMVAIAASVGAILYFKFHLTIPEAAPISFGIFLTLLLVHYQISRVRDKMIIDEQMDDLTRLKLTLTKEVQDVRELAHALDESVSLRLQKEVEPILTELDVIGSLVKQLAESCAELDERVVKGETNLGGVNEQLAIATQTVRELEELLRTNVRSLGVRAPASSLASQTSAPHSGSAVNSDSGKTRDSVTQTLSAIQPEDEAAVKRALALGEIELFMQPIVSLPMRKPQYYEALSRLKTDKGDLISPDVFLPVCAKNSFFPMLDRLAINEAFRLLRRLADRGRAVDCFCNLSLESLSDSDFFSVMRDLFEQNRDLAEHVILEFSQADIRSFGMLEEETVKLLNGMGFRFSVDQITDLSDDFDALSRKGIKFAKIATPVLVDRDAGRGLDIHPADFSRVLSRKGVDLIVTHVEHESDLVGLIDFNIHLAQGNHFAPAKALKSAAVTPRGADQTDMLVQQPQAQASRPAPQSASQSGPQSGPQSGTAARGPSGSGQASLPGAANKGNELDGAARTLGENPRVAEALRAMAAADGGGSDTRDSFRSALAQAAGLMGPGEPTSRGFSSVQAAGRNGATSPRSDRLPASGDFGLKTGTDRGQFIDLARLADETERQDEERNASATPQGQRFEKLIR